jgi:hypothetical protein
MSKDAFYFPHDYNAIQDPKMMTVLTECGLSGVAMFWIIIEILHQQESGTITEEEYKNYINLYCHFQSQGQHLLDKIEQVLINSKLLLNKDGVIYSERVNKNKKHREEISEKRSFAGKKSSESRLKSTNVEHLSTNVNKERKGKERKYKDSKPPSAFLSIEDFLKSLKTNPAYTGIDIDRELAKMDAWLITNPGRKKTQRFIVNWLNKIDKPLSISAPLVRRP